MHVYPTVTALIFALLIQSVLLKRFAILPSIVLLLVPSELEFLHRVVVLRHARLQVIALLFVQVIWSAEHYLCAMVLAVLV